MQKADSLVWSEKWHAAIEAYGRALGEFPSNTTALMGYAWALFHTDRTIEALKIYLRLTEVQPDDPGPFERAAELYERLEKYAEAATMYLGAAERYRKQEAENELQASLEASVRNSPHQAQIWGELLKYYEIQQNNENAILSAYWLAYLYQEEHADWAIEVCRQMQKFIPGDPRIKNVLQALQSHREILEPPGIGSEIPMPDKNEMAEGEDEEDGTQGTPTEQAQKRALEDLAQSIFSEDKPKPQGMSEMEASLLISQALDAQTKGDLVAAQDAYEKLLKAQVYMPSIAFNLGLIYKEQMRFAEAIAQFEGLRTHPEYVMGCNYALGECYQAQGKFDIALKYFLETLKIIDLNTIQHEQADDLIRVYESLAQNLVSTGEAERVKKLSHTLVDFLGQRGWEEELLKARKRLDGLARSGPVLSLAEIVSLPESEHVLRSVALSQEYMRRNKPYKALEELFFTIGKAPSYMPLHHLLGTFMMDNGKIDEAVDKFRMIAHTYEIRNQANHALATYQQILVLAPLDIKVHQRTIELLIQSGNIDKALDQYLQMADAYYQLAQSDRARETYAEALKLAPRGSAGKNWEVRIRHRMADMDMQRLDWLGAIKSYEEILRIEPDDERAYLGLMRLYPRTGRAHLGINTLDKLLKHYLSSKKAQKALAILEELVQEDEDNMALRARIAQLSLNMGQRDKALEHLDILGDLQLEAGQKEAAIKTIEMILLLGPSETGAYEQLYREMTGKEPPKPR